jgi:WD40 repeat protein
MPKISISYRRADSEAITGRIFDRLIAHFGKDSIFRDIDNIPLGIDFRQHINETLLKTNVLLAIVGPEWLGQRGETDRIREAADPVRVEIETALRRRVPLVPILIGNAKMPTEEQLPPGLKDFAFRNAIKVDTGLDFDYHMERLIRELDGLLKKSQSGETKIPPGLAKPPTGEKPVAKGEPSGPSSKSQKIPAALGAFSFGFGGAKEKLSPSPSITPEPSPAAGPAWREFAWPADRSGRIVRIAGAAVVVAALVAIVVFSVGNGLGPDGGKPLLALTAHSGPVTSVAYSANSRMIASGSLDRSVRIWNAESGEAVRTLQGDPGAVSAVAFLADSHRLATASLYGDIAIWSVDNGRQILPIQSAATASWVSTPAVRALVVSPDGARLASATGGTNSAVTIWSASTGSSFGVLHGRGGRDEDFQTVAFAPDGKSVVAGTKAGAVYVWDAQSGKLLHTFTEHQGQVLSIAVSPDGRRLAAAGDGNAVVIWNAATGQYLRTLSSGSTVVGAIAFSPDGRYLAVGGADAIVELFDPDNGQIARSLRGHSKAIRSLAFSPDGQRLAAGSDDDTVDVWAVR